MHRYNEVTGMPTTEVADTLSKTNRDCQVGAFRQWCVAFTIETTMMTMMMAIAKPIMSLIYAPDSQLAIKQLGVRVGTLPSCLSTLFDDSS